MKAFSLIRDNPVYRREAFERGLAAVGYSVQRGGGVVRANAGDVLLMWNRYAEYHAVATRFEDEGGRVLVAENAYVANDRANRTRYAIALGGHNGSGLWPTGGADRWAALGVPVQPWRTTGGHVLVCPNRNFGSPQMLMPSTWMEQSIQTLRKYTKREIRVRPHPGNDIPKRPLSADLAGAWAVLIWTSSAGCEALLAGIPVYCGGRYWVAMMAALHDLKTIENPPLLDRMPALHRVAAAQWHIEEIARGDPFQCLLNPAHALGGCL